MGDKIKQINDYFIYSGIWIGFVFNPAHWLFDLDTSIGGSDDEIKHIFKFNLTFGFVWVRIIIDNGEW